MRTASSPRRLLQRLRVGTLLLAAGLVLLVLVQRSPAEAQRPNEAIAVVIADEGARLRLSLIRGGEPSAVADVEGPRAVEANGTEVVALTADRLVTVDPTTTAVTNEVPLFGDGRSLAVDASTGLAHVTTTVDGRWVLLTIDLATGETVGETPASDLGDDRIVRFACDTEPADLVVHGSSNGVVVMTRTSEGCEWQHTQLIVMTPTTTWSRYLDGPGDPSISADGDGVAVYDGHIGLLLAADSGARIDRIFGAGAVVDEARNVASIETTDLYSEDNTAVRVRDGAGEERAVPDDGSPDPIRALEWTADGSLVVLQSAPAGDSSFVVYGPDGVARRTEEPRRPWRHRLRHPGGHPMSTARRHAGLAIPAVLMLAVAVLVTAPASAQTQQVTYVVSAHPDDEASVWSQIMAYPNDFQVFIFMSQGEASTWCGNEAYDGPTNWTGGVANTGIDYGEDNPQAGVNGPWAGGLDSAFCRDARQYSTRNLFEDMEDNENANMPGDLQYQGLTGAFPARTGLPVPINYTQGGTGLSAAKAEWWSAGNGKGVIIFFDVGDGDVTVDEVRWVIETVRANRSTFGIPSGTVRHGLGIYRALSLTNCLPYDNPDHRSVHQALFNHNPFGGATELGRTCGADPDRDTTLTRAMGSNAHGDWFAGPSTSQGDYHNYYGWLYSAGTNSGTVVANWYAGGPTSRSASPPLCGNSSTSSNYECGAIYTNVQHFWRR